MLDEFLSYKHLLTSIQLGDFPTFDTSDIRGLQLQLSMANRLAIWTWRHQRVIITSHRVFHDLYQFTS